MTDSREQYEEKVLLVAHKHWASLLPEITAALVPALVLLFFLFLPAESVGFGMHVILALIIPLGFLVIWIVIMMFWSSYYLNMLVITDRRIFYTEQVTMVNHFTREWDIRDVKHVSVHVENALESFFKYGTLYLESRSDSEVTEMQGIAEPEDVAAVILKQDDNYGQLQETSRKQQELLKFISHEVKGHLAKSKAAFASIVEGDYGPVPSQLGSLAQSALADSQQGVDTVMSILDTSDFSRGSARLEKKPFDLSAAVERAVAQVRGAAVQKQLGLSTSVDKFCAMVGDVEKIEKHVIRNLLDNAVRYTPAGRVEVSLKKGDGVARLSVADTGVGISAEDMKTLFTQGGHGKESRKVNPESTGYGLFIAKQLVEAHGGRIRAESNGPGSGSVFVVELPIVK
ncbi:MAG: HAMP domain-containing sensor histidine kinase [Patescibacteria group bacterium]|nr:HAMP domain-containing sensor histidine kinase [Patescibacteria group bacterium]